VSECRPSSLSSGIGTVTWAYARRSLFRLPSVSCAYLYGPQRSRAVVGPSLGHVHGSGGRLSDLANLCPLPAQTRLLVLETVRSIPRIFRIMVVDPRRPPFFQAGHTSRWRGSCGSYALS
jgi:hypothetical protein